MTLKEGRRWKSNRCLKELAGRRWKWGLCSPPADKVLLLLQASRVGRLHDRGEVGGTIGNRSSATVDTYTELAPPKYHTLKKLHRTLLNKHREGFITAPVGG